MPASALVLVALLSLGAADATAPKASAPGQPPAAPPATQERDFDHPPPGTSPEDRGLWLAGYDASNHLLTLRSLATRLQLRAKQGAYEERLEVLARRGEAAAREAQALRDRLAVAWNESADLLTRQWPVDPTRGCRYALLTFDGVLLAKEYPRKAAQLAIAREELLDCVGRARGVVDVMAGANMRLEWVLNDLDRELESIPVASASAPVVPPPRAGTKGTP